MNSAPVNDRDAFLENLAAEFTGAVYPVVLRHGVGLDWLDLQLDLWKTLIETVRRLELAGAGRVAGPNGPAKSADFFG